MSQYKYTTFLGTPRRVHLSDTLLPDFKGMDILKVIGKNVRFLRELQGYSQEELAEKSGIDRSYVGHVERGERNLSVGNLCLISAALKVHPSTLFIEGVFSWEGEISKK